MHGLAVLAATVWAGGVWAIGYLAVPLLFHALPDRMLAGMLAGQMFAGMAYAGLVCGLYLLLYGYLQYGSKMLVQRIFQVVLLMLLLLVVGQFGLQPAMAELKAEAWPVAVMHSDLAAQFRMLHGVASILYLLQSLLALLLVLGLAFQKRPDFSA